ncbi:T9SS type A sorting domain-containing protein [Flammeovirga aprica]|uniref:T9SS type A sorting domain-containing protein n=1 Tax=Flammeovirga aprica JL-4 TaxID=694437 RepID=A0A7X9RZH6_9BACT|nr:T9SS type A sorting domain-containing protein [Flammeovirga aprica]NME71484.1 T9SS type A sorting domain-containing protein [Flammeovirga aprica JL-4]
MIKKLIPLLLSIFITNYSWSQHIGLTLQQDISIIENGNAIPDPWNGGINAVQFFEVDLSLDGKNELVLFDRTSRRVIPYVYEENQWVYAPQYIPIFPSSIRFWMHLQDLDNDGQKDLIIGEEDGIYFYKNTSSAGQLSFSENGLLIESTSFSGSPAPLLSSLLDTPAFYDINNDVALDFFTFVPSVGGSIEYHQHVGLNDQGAPQYKKITNNWGNFHECGDCATYIFDGQNCSSNGRIMHLGSAVTIYDINKNGLGDVLIGEMSCSNLVAIPNKGSNDAPLFDESITNFPSKTPVSIPVFPAAFFIDYTQNNEKEMLISPNLTGNDGDQTDFSHSTWMYTFNDATKEFEFEKSQLFQTLDFGERSKPFAVDIDQNGQLDLLVGYRNSFNENLEQFGGGIAYLKNTGTNENPSFELIENDYLSLSEWGKIDIIPFFIDYDNDGTKDLLVSARTVNSNEAGVYLLPVENNKADFGNASKLVTHRPEESVSMYDINKDGRIDIVVGTFSGELKTYLQNENHQFQESSENFFPQIEADLLRKYPVILFEDLNNDGNEDLLVFDESGLPRIWRNYNNETEKAYQKDVLFDVRTNTFQSISLGRKNSGTKIGNYIIVGSEGGGLQLSTLGTHESPTSILPIPPSTFNVNIYPNPSNAGVTIENQGNVLLEYSILSMQAQKIAEGKLSVLSEIKLSTQNWAKGVYIIQLRDGNGKLFTKKLLVQ